MPLSVMFFTTIDAVFWRENSMKDFKKAIMLVKLSPRFKFQVMFAVLFTAFGIIYDMTTKGTSTVGGFYLGIPSSVILQAFYGSNISGMVKSSPIHKKTETLYPYVFVIPYMIIIYLILVAFHFYMTLLDINGGVKLNYAIQSKYIIIIGFEFFVVMIYEVFAYKYFVFSMIVFAGILIPTILISMNVEMLKIFDICGESYMRSSIIGLVLTIAGCVAAFFFSRLLYKKEMSPLAIKSFMRHQ